MKDKIKRLFSINKTFSIKGFINYLKENPISTFLITIIVFILQGYWINKSFSYNDVDIFINNPGTIYNWMDIGRFGLIFERKILNLSIYNQYFSEVLLLVGLVIFCLLCSYLFEILSQKKIGFLSVIIPLVMLSSPIFVEQFLFCIQIAEIAFAFCIMPISIMLIYEYIFNKNILDLVISIFLIYLVIGTYQSLVVMYMLLCIFSFIMASFNKELFEKNILKITISMILTFVISYGLYLITCQLLHCDMAYLTAMNNWKTHENISDVFILIKDEIINILFAHSIFYTNSFVVGMIIYLILALKNQIHNKNKISIKIYIYIVNIGLILCTFLLIVYSGAASVIRSYIYLPLANALIWLYIGFYVYNYALENKRYVKKCAYMICILYIIFTQGYNLFKLYYTNDMRIAFEERTLININNQLGLAGAKENDIVIFIGNVKPVYNESCFKEKDLGNSQILNTQIGGNCNAYPYNYYGSDATISRLKNMGYNYTCVEDIRYYQEALDISKDNNIYWPEQGYVFKYKDYFIVNLSNENVNF